MQQLKFRKLRADEIDVRAGHKTKSGNISLLLYKDARCDMNLLDEVVGQLGWKREHTRDNANCIVSIWDDDNKQWVSKEDTGTESNTEREKGLASDSFKRACFNWGIGRELYTAPQIFVSDPGQYESYTVDAIDYDDYGNICHLVIKSSLRGVLFKYGAPKTSVKSKPLSTEDDSNPVSDLQNKLGLKQDDALLSEALEAVKACKTSSDVTAVWNKEEYASLKTNEQFVALVRKYGSEFKTKEGKK